MDFSFKGSDTEYSFIEDGLRLGTKLLYGDDYEDPSMTIRQGPYEIIEEILKDYEDIIGNNSLLFKAVLYLELCLKKPRNRHIKEQYLKNIAKSKKELNAIEMLELEFVKRLKENILS